jgi:DNA-binding NtrC family response regulator
MSKILVVDDDASVRYTLSAVLSGAGHQVVTAATAEEGLLALDGEAPELAISDLSLPGIDGLEFLARAKDRDPRLPVLMITAHGSERKAVESMKRGAFDYLRKPYDVDELLLTVSSALEQVSLRRENRELKAQLSLSRPVIHRSAAMAKLMALTHRAALRNVTVLIAGETGTGKELIATALHELSARAEGPFVKVNMGAIPAGLAESELFGHQKGAFTGALHNHVGLFERAHRGSLFLDEIGELPLELQAKLLRVLQEGEVQPLGAPIARKVDVRIITATHKTLHDEVRAGRFREDLYYRLNVVELRIPPLRDRPEDVALLTHHYVQRCAEKFGIAPPAIEPDLTAALSAQRWPGNVRELENTVERLVALSDGESLGARDLGGPNAARAAPSEASAASAPALGLRQQVEAFEATVLREALLRNGGNQSACARELRISRVTLIDKLNKYGLR